MAKNKLKSNFVMNSEINSLHENLNLLNNHFWNCQIRIDKLNCPICKLHRKYVINKIKINDDNENKQENENEFETVITNNKIFKNSTKKNLNENNYENEHLIILAIHKFILFIEKKLLINIDAEIIVTGKIIQSNNLIKDFNVIDLFFLKMRVLKIIDTKLIRNIIYCSYMHYKYPNNLHIQLYSNFFKLSLKSENPKVFIEYDNLKIEDELRNYYNKTISLSRQFFQDLAINEIKYSKLLFKYLEFGIMHDKIKENLNSVSKNLKQEKRINLIIYIASYKFIFNSLFDNYLTQMNDIEDNIKLIEIKFENDNILELNFDLIYNNLIIRKVPTNLQFINIFNSKDIGKSFVNFFPRIIRKMEKKKIGEMILKNKTNHFSIMTYLMDKENLLNRVLIKFKIFMTVESQFRIYANLEMDDCNQCLILYRFGKIEAISKEFSNTFLIQPQLLMKHQNLKIFQFLKELLYKDREEDLEYDLLNKKDILINVCMSDYNNKYTQTIKTIDDVDEKASNFDINLINFGTKLVKKVGSVYLGKNERKTFRFRQIEKREIENDIILFYNFKREKIKAKLSNVREENSESEFDKSGSYIFKSKYLETQTEMLKSTIPYYNVAIDNEPVLTESLMTINSSMSKNNKMKEDNYLKVFNKHSSKYSEYTKNSKSMNKFYYYIITINILIVIIGIVFLFLIDFQLISIFSRFQIIQGFILESFRVYNNYLGVVSLVTIKNSENKYSKLDSAMNLQNPYLTIDITQFLKEDMLLKLERLDNITKSVHLGINSYFPIDFVNEKINFHCELFTFSESNNNLGYKLTQINLFDLMQIFKSFIYTIANDPQIIFGIDIINLSNNSSYIQKTNEYLSLNNSPAIRNLIQLVINYDKNFHNHINDVIDNLFNYQELQIHNLETLILISMIVLFVIDFFNLYLTFNLLRIYRQQVKLVMSLIYSLDKETLKDLIEKHKSINIFFNFIMSPTNALKRIKMITKKNSNKNNEKTINNYKIENKINQLEIKDVYNSVKFINDDYFILKYFQKIFRTMFFIICVYFSIAFVIINNQIMNMNTRVDLNEKFLFDLRFMMEEIISMKSSLLLNKTNIEDDYFNQEINADSFLEDSFNFSQLNKNIIKIENKHSKSMPILDNFFKRFQGENICDFLSKINRNFLDQKFYSFKLEDVESSILYLCKDNKIMKTDLFSIMEYINIKLREITFKYVNGPKDLDSIKSLIDSEEISEINIMGIVILRPLVSYLITDVLTPAFENDLNDMLIYCVLILILNILLNFSFLLIKNKFILKKTVNNVESLNILLKILS